MSLYVILYETQQTTEPIAVRQTLAEALACCKERAKQIANNLDGRVLVRDRQCLVEFPGKPKHIFTLYEVEDIHEQENANEVAYNYCEHGYEVHLIKDGEIVERYFAGNSAYDSQSYVSLNSPCAISLEQLAKFAKQTAEEWAAEHGNCSVKHDVNMIVN